MAVGFSKRREYPAPLDTVLWTATKDGRCITAMTRVSSEVEGVETRYTLNGEFLFSYRYLDHALSRVVPDLTAKRDALIATGWIVQDARPTNAQ